MGMRRGRDNAWMFDDHDHMIAINLGADFTAEHEWGIMDLYRTLGITYDEKVLGIDRYRTNPNPESVIFVEKSKNEAALIVIEPFDVRYWNDDKLKRLFDGELKIYQDEDLATAWCGKTFGIRVKKPKNIKHLRRIHKAMMEKDAAVWLGGGHVFQNAGLVVGIISAIPEASKKTMYDAHVDANELQEAAAKVGIKEKIDAINSEFHKQFKGFCALDAPCGYLSLKPAWAKGRTTKHKVMYWLNPADQKKNESGWYTVEELEQWIKGEGRVLKANRAV